jgi:hypothetical protein
MDLTFENRKTGHVEIESFQVKGDLSNLWNGMAIE